MSYEITDEQIAEIEAIAENDREILELAAKAAGLPHIKPTEDYDGSLGLQAGSDNPMRCWEWNPLKDDGDALRLAVKLNIQVSFYRNHLSTTYYPDGSFYKRNCCIVGGNVEYGEDKYAATRLAITRAAAEIGRSMQ